MQNHLAGVFTGFDTPVNFVLGDPANISASGCGGFVLN